jgi:hypothetical protein
MAICTQCKRPQSAHLCPALVGPICQTCCTGLRLIEIDCPEDCEHLLEKEGASPQPGALERVTELLLEFAVERPRWGGRPAAQFLGKDRRIADWEQGNFMAYLSYGYRDKKGDRMVDIFLRERGATLPPDAGRALDALRGAWFSLFEVQDIRLDEGIAYLDLVSGARLFVKERIATHHLHRLDLTLGWLVELEGNHLLTTACNVPRAHREEVLEAIRRSLGRLRTTRAGVEDRALMRLTAPAAHRALRRAVEDWQQHPPKLVTTDGEDLVICQAIFDVVDAAAVHKRLLMHPDIEEADDRLVWVDRADWHVPGPLHLGTLRLAGQRLVLETHSRERVERGKAMLCEHLGDLVRHRLDALKDMEVAMAEAAAAGPRRSAVAPEEEAVIVRRVMEQWLVHWIDTELPALGGRTPREAVRSKPGRKKVAAMLKDQEHATRGMPGGDLVDFSPIYQELGLPEE